MMLHHPCPRRLAHRVDYFVNLSKIGAMPFQFPRFLYSVCFLFALASAGATAHAGTCCVWRVTSVSQPFYLVGTIHALSSKDYPLPAGYKQAFRDSKRFLFEMKPDPQDHFSREFSKAAMYPKGDDIRRHVHPKTWAILRANYSASNSFAADWYVGPYHLDSIQQLRPWAIAWMLWQVRGYSDAFHSLGVDNHLEFDAKRAHKEIDGLETVDEHVEVISGMNDIESELMLLETLTRGSKVLEDNKRDRTDWRRGDIQSLWTHHQWSRRINPGGDVRLLDMRNVKWIPRIRAEMKTGKPTSIVAGVDHFLGPNGVVELLDAAVTRSSSSEEEIGDSPREDSGASVGGKIGRGEAIALCRSEAPNPNTQTPENLQSPSSNCESLRQRVAASFRISGAVAACR